MKEEITKNIILIGTGVLVGTLFKALGGAMLTKEATKMFEKKAEEQMERWNKEKGR